MELIKLVTFKLLLFNILIFTLSYSISSCGDDTAEPFDLIDMDTTGKTIIQFDSSLANYANVNMGQGSIFIYETADGLLDTTIVRHSQVVYNIKGDIAYTGYEQIFDCSKTADYQIDLSIWKPHIDSSLWFEHQLIAPAGVSQDIYVENGVYKPQDEVNLLDSVLINNNVYYDILIIKKGSSFYNEIWYAKNIGIIMKKAWFSNEPAEEFYLIDYEIK